MSKLLDAGGGVNVGAANRRKVRTISESATGKLLAYTVNPDDDDILAGNDPRVEAAKAKVSNAPAADVDPIAEARAKSAERKAAKAAAKAAAEAEANKSDDIVTEDDPSEAGDDAVTTDESEAGNG